MKSSTRVLILCAALLTLTVLAECGYAMTITPVSASDSNHFNLLVTADETRNSSGLIGNTHSTSVADGWLTATLGALGDVSTWTANLAAVTISWDLGYSYNLSTVHLWNDNEAGNTHRGIASAVVDISEFSNFASPTTINLSSLTQAPGLSNYTGEDYALVATGRYVRFSSMTKFTHPGTGDPNQYIGLSEIRFEGRPVPEPSSLVLLTLAAIGFCRLSRSKNG